MGTSLVISLDSFECPSIKKKHQERKKIWEEWVHIGPTLWAKSFRFKLRHEILWISIWKKKGQKEKELTALHSQIYITFALHVIWSTANGLNYPRISPEADLVVSD